MEVQITKYKIQKKSCFVFCNLYPTIVVDDKTQELNFVSFFSLSIVVQDILPNTIQPHILS